MALNNTQKMIVEAVSNYRGAARGLVVAFETTIDGYWNTDSCNPVNVQFFLNALKKFPVLQRAAKGMLPKFGKFKIALNKAESKGTDKVYTVTNDKGKDGATGLTKEEKVAYRMAVKAFIASEHASLLHEKSTAKKVGAGFEFDEAKTVKSIESSIEKQLLAMLKANPDANAEIMRRLFTNAMDKVLSAGAVSDTRKKARDAIADAAKAA